MNIHTIPKTALISGATGFIGSYVAGRLVSEGWNVHLITRPTSNLELLKNAIEKITIHRYNGTMGEMNAIVRKSKPDIVFHLASLFLSTHKPEDVKPLINSNIIFGTQLVEAMTANGVSYLINTSTSWQHYENENYNPVCLYAATKQAFESIVKYYTETTPLKVITLKLFDTYGPNDPRPKLFNILQKNSVNNSSLAMSPGEQLIDIVYIDDVVDAFVLAANRLFEEKVEKNEVYFVSSGKPIKLKELVDIYCQIMGTDLNIDWGGRDYRPREVMIPWSKGKKLPRWKPRVSLDEGIRRLKNI